MPRLITEIAIHASSTAVFDHLLALHTDAAGQYRYALLGIRVKGEYELIEQTAPRYLLLRTTSGIEALIELALEPVDGGTHLMLTADYALPGTLLGGATNRMTLEAQLERDVATALYRFKAVLEVPPDLTERPAE
ncbi:MAG: hypothetical protein SF123_02325 [Chloroflexota bacterium]|nr:hypothetical protein [Chloroflexota bacterium]